MSEPVRFTEILTTGASIATYLGAQEVTASHLRFAVAVLRGAARLDDLGPVPSPLGRRNVSPQVAPGVREVVQRWFAALARDPLAELPEDAVQRLLAEIEAAERGEDRPEQPPR